ncbi:hypothetical protein [Roseivirga sp.]|uniref:hypothetical protein n=1 Tax=Roseivirga sp. TaxID=1964215 RepID=UPI003B8E8AA3
MRKSIQLFSILLILSCLSCNNSDSEPDTIPDGTFIGTFTVEYMDGRTYSNPVSVTFKSGEYYNAGNVDKVPAGGSGKFTISNGLIEFIDENFWTAEFDWNLILSGKYSLLVTDAQIRFSAEKHNVGTYTYNLENEVTLN